MISYKSVSNGQLNTFKNVIVTQINWDNQSCVVQERIRAGSTFQVSLGSTIGVFYNYPRVGEVWVVHKMGSTWVLWGKSGMQNPDINTMKDAEEGVTVMNGKALRLRLGDDENSDELVLSGNNITSTSTKYDTWQSKIDTLTVGGVASSVVTTEWKTSLDRTVWVNYNLTCPTAPTTLNFTMPFTTDSNWVNPDSHNILIAVIADNGAAVPSQVLASRVVTPWTGITLISATTNASSLRRFACTFSYPIAK